MWKRYCLSLFHILFMYSFIFSLFVGNRFIQLTLISAYAGKLLCCVEELDAIRSSQQERWSLGGKRLANNHVLIGGAFHAVLGLSQGLLYVGTSRAAIFCRPTDDDLASACAWTELASTTCRVMLILQ